MIKRIAIIGSGTAGASLALMLNRYPQFQVEVFERELNPKPVGSGILLQLTGIKILQSLGLGEKLDFYGVPIKGFSGREKNGKEVFNIDFLKYSKKTGLGISRGVLFSILHESLRENGIILHEGKEITQFDTSKEKASIYSADGSKYEGYDLIVAASGAGSMLREDLTVTKISRRQKWAAIWTKVPYPVDVFDSRIYHKYKGAKRFLGFMPIGKAYDNPETNLVNVFWSVRFDEGQKMKEKGKAYYKQTLLDFAPEFASIIDEIDNLKEEDIVLAPYFDSKITPQYYKRVAFIGDIAHAMSPQLSQGASFALLDAQSLAKALIKHENIDKALKVFYKKRKLQVNYYYYTSKITTMFYQSDKKIAWLRNSVLSWILKIPLFAKMVTETVLGYRKGVFSKLKKGEY